MKKLLALIALVLAASAPSPLSAQGLIAPGHVLGNGTAATRTPTDATLTSVFDRAFCATNGQTLVRSAGTWQCGAVSPGSLTLTNTHIFVGNASNVAADVAMSGDATISNTGVLSIGATKVTSAMLNADVFSTAHTWSALQTAQGLTTTSPGWYVQLTGDTFPRMRIGLNSVDVASLAFGPGNVARDTFIERVGVGALRFGAPDAAAPVSQTNSVQNVVAGTSNTAGADRTIAASQGTGTGVGGKIIFQTAPAGGSGTSQNALVTALTIFGGGGLNAGNPTGGDKGAGTVNMTGCFVNNVACLTSYQSITLSGDVTGSGTTVITTVLANIPSATPMAGSLLATNIAAPGTPVAGKTSIYVDSTSKNIASKNDAGTVNHGIQTRTASANNWIRSIADDGSTAISQPAVSDISGFGTGVATALGGNIGSAGAFVTLNGALGTPSSGVATNLTGTAAGLTVGNVSGTGVGSLASLAIGGATIGANALAVTGPATISGALTLGTSGILFGGTNTLDLRNGTNAQQFRIYNTFTDASNYEALFNYWSANVAYYEIFATGTGNTGRNFVIGTAGGMTGSLFLESGGTNRWRLDSSGNFYGAATGAFGFNSAALGSGSQDVFVTRAGPAAIRFGAADAASPVAQTINVQGVVAGTSNTAGANFTIAGSQGTGTGAGGSLLFQVAPAGSTGTAQNALSTVVTIASTGAVTLTGTLLPQTITGPSSLYTISSAGVFSGLRVDIGTTAKNNLTLGGAGANNGTVQNSSSETWALGYTGALATLGHAVLSWNSSGLVMIGDSTTFTSSFPALKRSAATLVATLADNSADATFQSAQLIVSGIASDATHTDATVCVDTTSKQLYSGSGTLGICLGTSSARYKRPETFRPLMDGLAELSALKPLNYRYMSGYGDGGMRTQYGFLAEDVIDVLPLLVGLDAAGRPNSVDILGMVPIIVRAVQQLRASNDNLRADNDNLRRDFRAIFDISPERAPLMQNNRRAAQ